MRHLVCKECVKMSLFGSLRPRQLVMNLLKLERPFLAVLLGLAACPTLCLLMHHHPKMRLLKDLINGDREILLIGATSNRLIVLLSQFGKGTLLKPADIYVYDMDRSAFNGTRLYLGNAVTLEDKWPKLAEEYSGNTLPSGGFITKDNHAFMMTFDEIPNSKIPGRGSWYNISFFKLDQNEFFHFGIKRSLFPPKTFATDEPLTVYDISPIKKSENCFAKVSYIEKTKRTNPSRPPNPPHGPPQGPPHGPSPSCLCNKDGSFKLISLSDNNDCSDKVTVAVAFQAGDWLVFFNVDDKRDAVIFPKSAIITEPYTPTNLAGLGSDDKNGQVFPIGKLVNPSNGTMQYNSSKDDGPQNHHNDPNHPNDSHDKSTSSSHLTLYLIIGLVVLLLVILLIGLALCFLFANKKKEPKERMRKTSSARSNKSSRKVFSKGSPVTVKVSQNTGTPAAANPSNLVMPPNPANGGNMNVHTSLVKRTSIVKRSSLVRRSGSKRPSSLKANHSSKLIRRRSTRRSSLRKSTLKQGAVSSRRNSAGNSMLRANSRKNTPGRSKLRTPSRKRSRGTSALLRPQTGMA